jgi:hypothetical protein
MRQGARTPEELETLFEDAFVLRDPEAVAALFEARALLVAGAEARGNEEIVRWAAGVWADDYTYVADRSRVVQAHDVALVLAPQGTSVVRRGAEGTWRYAISLLSIDHREREDQ